MDISNVIKELTLFSDKVLELKTPVNEQAIEDFESQFNIKLPEDYVIFLKCFNGISLMGTIIYGVGEELNPLSLASIYIVEHQEVGNPMNEYLIPFSPDGYGNHYCFDTRTMHNNLCNVVFWQHDYLYTEVDPPEITNASFSEWIKEVIIDWTLEDYDYNGNEK